MTMAQLEYFIAVGESLNFTTAASRLFVSQQSVSRQIKLLESEIGFPLFERDTRNVKLTDNGKMLYDVLIRHRSEFHEIISKAMMSVNGQQLIRIGILDLSKVVDFVIPMINSMELKYQHTTWEYTFGGFAELQDAIDRDKLDMIITLSTELPVTHPKEQRLILQDLDLGIFISNRHPLYDLEALSVQELKEETFYIFDQAFSYGAEDLVLSDCKRHGFYPKNIEYFSNFNKLELAVLSGKGITVGHSIFFRNQNHLIKCFPIDVPSGIEKANLILAWRKPEYKVFAKIFQEELVEN